MAERKDRIGKKQIGVYINAELAVRVDKYLKDEKRTLTYLVEESIDKFLKEYGV